MHIYLYSTNKLCLNAIYSSASVIYLSLRTGLEAGDRLVYRGGDKISLSKVMEAFKS